MPDSSVLSSKQEDKYWALVPAAGVGRRLGSATPKQYLKLHHKEVLAWTLQTLSELDFLEKTVLVLHPEDNYFSKHLAADFSDVLLVEGGEERQHSVAKGIEFLKSMASDTDWVLVHDAVRPCVIADDIIKLKNTLQDDEVGGILASAIKDTLKRTDASTQIAATLNRSEHWLAATPQLFRFKILSDALQEALQSGYIATDEAAAVEAMSLPVKLIEGRSDNIKITSQEDLALAEFFLMQLGKVSG